MFQSLSEININELCRGKTFYPSPAAWEDLVIYFLLPDRFSDNQERDYLDNDGNIVHHGSTPLYREFDRNQITTDQEKAAWREVRLGESPVNLGISNVWASPPSGLVPSTNK